MPERQNGEPGCLVSLYLQREESEPRWTFSCRSCQSQFGVQTLEVFELERPGPGRLRRPSGVDSLQPRDQIRVANGQRALPEIEREVRNSRALSLILWRPGRPAAAQTGGGTACRWPGPLSYAGTTYNCRAARHRPALRGGLSGAALRPKACIQAREVRLASNKQGRPADYPRGLDRLLRSGWVPRGGARKRQRGPRDSATGTQASPTTAAPSRRAQVACSTH